MFTAPGYSREKHEAPILVKLSPFINIKVPARMATLDRRGTRGTLSPASRANPRVFTEGSPEHPGVSSLSLPAPPLQRTPPSWQPSLRPRSSTSSSRRQPASSSSSTSSTHRGWPESARSVSWTGGGAGREANGRRGRRVRGRGHARRSGVALDSAGAPRTIWAGTSCCRRSGPPS